MDDQKVQKLLEELQKEIQHTDDVDEDGKNLLKEIDKEVHELLTRTGSGPIQIHPTLVERFESTIDLLEVTHPRITNYLAELLDILSNAGI